eukprot:8607802-Heterocapsa_arctica.AAC.1
MRTLCVAEVYPWRLCAGDMHANLQALSEHEESPSQDTTTIKIHQLLRIGWSRDKLKDGLDRMGEVHWTTLVQEQGHGSVSLVHRVHRSYGVQMLTQRAFIHMSRGLFDHPGASTEAARLQKLEAKIKAKESYKPQKLVGRNVFLADCNDAARAIVAPAERKAKSQQIMAKHAKIYSAFPQDTKDEYERRA